MKSINYTFSVNFNLLIVIFTYYISFEWFIFSIINDIAIVQFIRSIFDYLPLLLYFVYIATKGRKIKLLHLNVLFAFIVLLIFLVFSHIIDKTSLISIIPYFGVIFRFVPFFLMSTLYTGTTYNRLIKHIKIIYSIQVILAFIEIINKKLFLKVFLPNPSFFKGFIPTVYRDSGISTTFINTIEFSFFIIIIACLLIYEYRHSITKKWTVFLSSLIIVTASFSIASILLIFMMATIIIERKTNLYFYIAVGFMTLFCFGNSLFSIFTETKSIYEYYLIAKDYNRVGYFTNLLPQFFTSNLKDIFFGIGVDPKVIDIKLNHYNHIPKMLTFGKNNLILLKDVYWVSIIMTQGLIGFSILWIVLLYIFRRIKSTMVYYNYFILKLLLIVVFIGGFFNQILDLKGFSFVFWIFLGILINGDKNGKAKCIDCST
jgi:hypothetical protein